MQRRGLASVLVVLLAAGCERLEVTVFQVDRGPVESTVTSVEAGVIEPLHKAELALPVSGRIVCVSSKEGERVSAGTILVTLENALEKIEVEETEAELRRLRELNDVESKERIEHAEFAHRRAQVRYDQTFLRAPFNGLVAVVNARVGEMAYGHVPIAMGTAATREPLVYLVDDSRLFVKAYIDEADVGPVELSQPAKVTLEGQRERVLEGRVSYISPVVSTEEGETRTVEVRVEIVPRLKDREGVRAMGAAGQEGVSVAKAVATAAGDPPPKDGGSQEPAAALGDVLVGMSIDLEILVQRVEEAIRVPTMVILERGDEKYVYVVLDGILLRRMVVTGDGNWDRTQVLSGLSPGDLVVLPTEANVLRDGRKVKATLKTES